LNRTAQDESRKKKIKKTPPDFAVTAAAQATAKAQKVKAGALRSAASAVKKSTKAQPVKAKPDRKPQRDVTEKIMKSLERVSKTENQRQNKKLIHEAMLARWSHKSGTPETLEQIEIVPSRRRQHPLERMHQMGKISDDEINAAWEIQRVREILDRETSISSASLEARIDFSGSARNALIESLGRIRLEVAYTIWRKRLVWPALVLQMIYSNMPYTTVAKRFRTDPRKARRFLLTALRDWIGVRIDVEREIDREAVETVYAKLGETF
jgi:hypothetical protein